LNDSVQYLFDKLKDEIGLIMSQLKLEIRKELRDQGHILTGTLERSIDYEVTQWVNKLVFSMVYESYGEWIDTGVPNDKIPYSRGSGAGSSKYIDGLKRFWMLRGLGAKAAKQAAFATANKHKAEGMPTKKSFSFSNNGRRLGFFSLTIDNNLPNIEKQIQDAVGNVAQATIYRLLDNVQNQANRS
jgi:hypothetical protein